MTYQIILRDRHHAQTLEPMSDFIFNFYSSDIKHNMTKAIPRPAGGFCNKAVSCHFVFVIQQTLPLGSLHSPYHPLPDS